jgi:hypothetical protein
MYKQLLILLSLLSISCSTVKNTQEAINTGNYETAISSIITKLQKNKTAKWNQPYIALLEDSFQKIVSRDLKKIDYLKKDQNKESLEKIYNMYTKLNTIQNKITPLEPLYIVTENRNANFEFNNYDDEIFDTKNQLSEYLYNNIKKLFYTNNKFDYRKAYNDLMYLDKIDPNYKDVRKLINTAQEKGSDFVIVTIKNDTQKIISKRLENDLLNFDAYDLDNLWTVYHSTKDARINYDFGIELNMTIIDISPERVREKEMIKERKIKKGFKYLLDKEGKQVLDKEGKKVKVDQYVKVQCKLFHFIQSKSAKVIGQVKYIDLNTRQTVQRFPITSEFVFDHNYAHYRGDKRALDDYFLELIKVKEIPFPSNEQMIYDIGQDLKERFKTIITQNKFRN